MDLKAEMRRLREVQWRQLDLSEAGSWPLALQGVSFLLAMAVALFLVNWFVANPKALEHEQAAAQEQQLLREYESKAYKASNLPKLREQMEELQGRKRHLVEMLPTGAEVPSLIDNISDAARDNQLVIDFIRLRSPVPRDFYVEQPFDIQVRGDYHRIGTFLSAVAALPRIVTLHDFTLEPWGEHGALQLALLAKTYSYQEEEP